MLVPQSYKVSVILGRVLARSTGARNFATSTPTYRLPEHLERSWLHREGIASPGSRRMRRMLGHGERGVRPSWKGSVDDPQPRRSPASPFREETRAPRTEARAAFGLRSTAESSFGMREGRPARNDEKVDDDERSEWKMDRQRWAMPNDEPPPLRFHDPSTPPAPPQQWASRRTPDQSAPPDPRLDSETDTSVAAVPKRPWEPTKKLTYAGMASLKALHMLDPTRFTRGHLSETFGISEEAVRRICRSTFRDKAVKALLADYRTGGRALTEAALEHGGLRMESDAGETPKTSHFALRGAAKRDGRETITLVGTKWDRDPGSSATYSAAGALVRAYRQVKQQ